MSAGSVVSPKNTKNTAANRSRSGANRWRATSATSSVKSNPTRKAATAAEKLKTSAIPATKMAAPNNVRSKATGWSAFSSAFANFKRCRESNKTAPTTASATPTLTKPAANPAPVAIAVTIGRYGAITMSSTMSSPTTPGTSALRRHFRSRTTWATMPELEI